MSQCGSSDRVSDLHPALQPYVYEFLRVARLAGINPVVTSTLRTRRQQACLYQQHVMGRSRFPAARPGQSTHESGLAFDLVPGNSADPHARAIALEALGRLWESWGGRWGGRFHDPIHFDALTSSRPSRRR